MDLGRTRSRAALMFSGSPVPPRRGPRDAGGAHLVGGGQALGSCERVLLVVGEHDEAHDAAEGQHNLLAGEHGVAGAVGSSRALGRAWGQDDSLARSWA